MIEIKTIGGRVLYTAENATDVRAALVEATRKRADLRGADLRGADLSEAYLRGADLRGADLREADLSGADLREADLSGADLSEAYLSGADLSGAYLREADLREAYLSGADLSEAYLRGAYLSEADLSGAYLSEADDDRRHPLHGIRADVFDVLDKAPAEVAGLRAALVAGKVNGSAYSGPCACLVGTLEQTRAGRTFSTDAEIVAPEIPGLLHDASRPAERWFMPISQGDTPSTEDDRTEGQYRALTSVRWIDEWRTERTAVAAALGTQASA